MNTARRKDIPIFLALIPFISAFNYYLTYSNIELSWFLLLTYAIDTGQGYIAWLGVRGFIRYLDVRMPYGTHPGRRIWIQLAGSLVIGLFIVAALTELVSWIAKGKPAPLNFYTIDLVIISIWFFVMNGVYVGLHYYDTYIDLEARRKAERQAMHEGLLVRQAREEIRLNLQEIAGFFVDGEYVTACHLSGRKYLLDQSLDRLEGELPQDHFFRLNRQYILHRNRIQGFRRADNGKLEVMLVPDQRFPTEIQVSRTKAQAFRRWFRPK